MAADVNDIIAYGFGSWSSVNWIPTLGFSTIAVVPTMPGLEYTLPRNRPHYSLPENRPHYILPTNRAHFEIPDDDP